MTSAARELARKVLADIGSQTLASTWFNWETRNDSSISAAEFSQGWEAFQDELKKEGVSRVLVEPPKPQMPTQVAVGLSETFQNFLWIARVQQSNSVRFLFVAVPRAAVLGIVPTASALTLRKQFLVSSPAPILDVALLPASGTIPARLVVLQPERIALFTQSNGAWQVQAEARIERERPWPRDIRGRLQNHFMNADGSDERIEAVLPGVVCSISLAGEFMATCKDAAEPWAISMTSPQVSAVSAYLLQNRNLFSYPIGGVTEQFYSIAEFELGPEEYTAVGAASDGRALLFEDSGDPTASFSGWGSDIVALAAPDRLRWSFLVTRSDDWTKPDAIQAFNIVDRQPVPSSGVVNFDGPVVTFWDLGADAAAVVSRNLKTGMYEAYLLRATYHD